MTSFFHGTFEKDGATVSAAYASHSPWDASRLHNFDSAGTGLKKIWRFNLWGNAANKIQHTQNVHGGKWSKVWARDEVRSDGCRSMRIAAAAASRQDDREGWTAGFGIKLTGREGRRERIKAPPWLLHGVSASLLAHKLCDQFSFVRCEGDCKKHKREKPLVP